MTDEASTGGTNPRSERAASSGVHLTRIYTRTGDDGTTGLSDFSRVPKNDPRNHAAVFNGALRAELPQPRLMHIKRS
ncbi:Cob(I)yrinic acid a,c-diamide adenosyltransferase [Mycobacteroides abscessus subsp. abscessus]|nr:Cob(I)yrinic acid a,c-diamide adenosyltransferase [Mycobacteroides abscessus subsp. abscessus]